MQLPLWHVSGGGVCLSLQVLVCREYVEQYKEVEFA